MEVSSFIESDGSDLSVESIQETDDKVNFIRIPWEGSPPKIVIDKSQKHLLKSPFDDDYNSTNDSMKCVRKIWFCRDINDSKKRTLKVWDLPLTWNNNNIRKVFNIFGIIQAITLKNQNNILDRHCLIRFKHSSKVDFAMNYDSSLIIQPLIVGSIKLGINKYLINYIKTRPHNIKHLQFQVDKFMNSFDKLQKQKREKLRQKPRRFHGWIQKKDRDMPGFTKIHYPSKFERKKNRAYRIINNKTDKIIRNDNENNNNNNNNNNYDVDGYGRSIRKGKIQELNPNDTFNAPPAKQVYDTSRKEAYYKMNNIKDIYKKKKHKIWLKQTKAKKKIKKQMHGEYSRQGKQRLSIAGARLRDSIKKTQRFNKDMAVTTNLRKNRNFKPI